MPPKAGCSSTVGQRTKNGGQTGQPRATTTPVEFEALPHRGYVEVDNFTGAKPLLVHKLTLERVPLPEGGKWCLEFGDDGSACAFDESGELDIVILAEEQFKRQVLVCDGEILVEQARDAKRIRWSLSAKQREYEQVVIQLATCGPL